VRGARDTRAVRPEPVVRRRLVVGGRVQGVGYRAHVARRARELGVTGFARNRADGTVLVELEGAPPVVGAVMAACRTGPRFAEVTRVEVSEVEPTGATSFETA
jgi:acylphosphatase